MTPDPSAVRDALDMKMLHQRDHVEVPHHALDALAAAARAWVEGEEVRWCVRHTSNAPTGVDSEGSPCWFISFAYRGQEIDIKNPPNHLPCRIVPARVCIDGAS